MVTIIPAPQKAFMEESYCAEVYEERIREAAPGSSHQRMRRRSERCFRSADLPLPGDDHPADYVRPPETVPGQNLR